MAQVPTFRHIGASMPGDAGASSRRGTGPERRHSNVDELQHTPQQENCVKRLDVPVAPAVRRCNSVLPGVQNICANLVRTSCTFWSSTACRLFTSPSENVQD